MLYEVITLKHGGLLGCRAWVRQGRTGDRHSRITSYNVCYTKLLRNIGAKFVQYAQLASDKDVLVESQMLHSQVTALGSVRVQDPGGRKGTLVGGRIQAGEQIEAVILGAQADNSTELVIRITSYNVCYTKLLRRASAPACYGPPPPA